MVVWWVGMHLALILLSPRASGYVWWPRCSEGASGQRSNHCLRCVRMCIPQRKAQRQFLPLFCPNFTISGKTQLMTVFGHHELKCQNHELKLSQNDETVGTFCLALMQRLSAFPKRGVLYLGNFKNPGTVFMLRGGGIWGV